MSDGSISLGDGYWTDRGNDSRPYMDLAGASSKRFDLLGGFPEEKNPT